MLRLVAWSRERGSMSVICTYKIIFIPVMVASTTKSSRIFLIQLRILTCQPFY